MKPTILLVCAVLLLSGCASYKLPAINAAEFSYHRTDPAGGTTITAKNVKVDTSKVKAEEAAWTTTYPTFSLHVEVKGYERALESGEKP